MRASWKKVWKEVPRKVVSVGFRGDVVNRCERRVAGEWKRRYKRETRVMRKNTMRKIKRVEVGDLW